jgi:hypothetical protein
MIKAPSMFIPGVRAHVCIHVHVSVPMQYRDTDIKSEHGYAAGTWTCSLDLGMQHEHGHGHGYGHGDGHGHGHGHTLLLGRGIWSILQADFITNSELNKLAPCYVFLCSSCVSLPRGWIQEIKSM